MDQELEPMDQILETLRNKIFDCKLALAAEKDRQRRVADVRKMITGDSNYENQSGDVTKGTVKAAVSAAGAAGAKVKDVADASGKKITGDEWMTCFEKARPSRRPMKDVADAAGKMTTGDENYEFGDATKGEVKGAVKRPHPPPYPPPAHLLKLGRRSSSSLS